MINTIELFSEACLQYNIILSSHQKEQFLKYYEILVEWNKVMNLTTITEFPDVLVKHFLDSVAICKFNLFQKNQSLIDVGTGAGFPGIPLKIIYPDLQVVLLDSLNKRINFLNSVMDALKLDKIETIHGRAEDMAHQMEFREQFDYSVSRAVANLSTLSELCLPFVKNGGCFISYKSEKVNQELDGAKKSLFLLGGEIKERYDYCLPDDENSKRNLIFISKSKKTPKIYPRKAGTPAKSPL